MKTILVIGIILFLGIGTTYGAVKFIRGEKFAQIGVGEQSINVYRVVDGDVVCYVTQLEKWGSHALSCVK